MHEKVLNWSGLRLRPLREGDAQMLNEAHNDPLIRDRVFGFRLPVPQACTNEWLQSTEHIGQEHVIRFAIEFEEAFCGVVQLTGIDWVNGVAIFGIWIRSGSQSQGVGSMATALLLDYAFEALRLEKLSLRVLAHSAKPIGLYRKLGFKEEGILRSEVYFNGARYDIMAMGLLKNEWQYDFPEAAHRLWAAPPVD